MPLRDTRGLRYSRSRFRMMDPERPMPQPCSTSTHTRWPRAMPVFMALALGSMPTMAPTMARASMRGEPSLASDSDEDSAPAKGCTVQAPAAKTEAEQAAWDRVTSRVQAACESAIGAAIGDPSVKIVLSGDTASHAYKGTIEVRRGEEHAKTTVLGDCDCLDEEIPAWTRAGVMAGLKSLTVAVEPEPEPKPEPEPEPEQESKPAQESEPGETKGGETEPEWTDADRRRTRGLGIGLTAAGAAVMAGGAAMAVVGGVLLPRFKTNEEFGFLEQTKHPGAPIILGVGVGLFVAGVVPLAIGICNLKKAPEGKGCLRKKQAGKQALVLPWMGRGIAGASIQRRF